MKELLERLKQPMNEFWTKVRKWLVLVSGFLIALGEFAQPLLMDANIPESFHYALRCAYIAGLFSAFVVSFTVSDNPLKG